MKYLIQAPGKLILIGEYAVLEGAPALVMAVNRYALVNVNYWQNEFSALHSPTLDICNVKFTVDDSGKIKFTKELSKTIQDQLSFFTETVHYLLHHHPHHYQWLPLEISMDTNDFFLADQRVKLGLGSSAAVTVALLKGLLINMDEKFRPKTRLQFFRWVQQIHSMAQGKKGSGIDLASSIYGGVISFQKTRKFFKIKKINYPRNLIILPIWSGESASTPTMIEKVNRLKSLHPGKYWRIMNQLQGFSSEAISAFQSNDVPAFLKRIGSYYEILKKLDHASGAGIITAAHKEIAHLVNRSGGIYKTSGAGGGDIGIAFTNSTDIARKVSENILRSGYQLLNLSLSKKGITVKHIAEN